MTGDVLADAVGHASAVVSVTRWTPGSSPVRAGLSDEHLTGSGLTGAEPGRGAGVSWIDVDVTGTEAPGCTGPGLLPAPALLELIGPLCGGQLDPEMLEDLLSCGSRPGDRSYGDGEARLAVAVQIEARDASVEDAAPEAAPQVRMLVCQPVGILAGDGWVITCWHRRQAYEGAMRIGPSAEPGPHDRVAVAVAKRWRAGPARTAGDLGVLILSEIALSFAPAHRRIYDWLEAWELTLYLDNDIEGKRQIADRSTLPDLWGAMAVMRGWISPLNHPGMRADIDRAWFSGCTDARAVENLNDRIDRALTSLRDLSATLRSSFGLLHLQVAEEQHARTERLQRLIEYVTAAVLIPALVVGFFGANTALPGAGTWWGFWVMVLVMVVLASVAWLVLRSFRRRETAEEQALADDRAEARAGLARELSDDSALPPQAPARA
jgi:CorA-like Mg2+ transporter protein